MVSTARKNWPILNPNFHSWMWARAKASNKIFPKVHFHHLNEYRRKRKHWKESPVVLQYRLLRSKFMLKKIALGAYLFIPFCRGRYIVISSTRYLPWETATGRPLANGTPVKNGNSFQLPQIFVWNDVRWRYRILGTTTKKSPMLRRNIQNN